MIQHEMHHIKRGDSVFKVLSFVELCLHWFNPQCLVDPADDILNELEKLEEGTYRFYLTTVFVPENERAYYHSMAGNTCDYTGADLTVPEDALEYDRCGYVSLREDGWHGELVGTGW